MIRVYRTQSDTAGGASQARDLLRHLLAHTLCTERHTITGLLAASGLQDRDWTGAYRLYAHNEAEPALFGPVREGLLAQLPPAAPLVVAVDDSTMHKTGKRIPTAGWYRDPLGPAFHTNLIYAQRFIQFSAALPDPADLKRARLIPIDFALIPKLPKLQADATDAQRLQHDKSQEENSPGAHARRMLARLRDALGVQQPARSLYLCGDGHYSNASLLQHLPPRTFYIGRVRGDIHLCAPAAAMPSAQRGRKPSYGPKLPTPEELRRNQDVPWQTLTLEQDGKTLTVHFKHIARAKWHAAGEKTVIQVLVLRGRRYRRRRDKDWHYTQPAYLIATDPALPVKDFIQFYLWRWDIEVNFRDAKQLFGLGQAQVRHPRSVQNAPALCLAAYAGLLLAATRTYGSDQLPHALAAPKWYPHKRKSRVTTRDLLRQLRHEAAARSLSGANFSGFSLPHTAQEKPLEFLQLQPASILEAAM